MNDMPSFRERFLHAKKPLCIVGAHDGLGAQLIAQHGFDGVWASGLEISASHGVPDANILTMTQYLERAQEMRMASNLPVIADVDTGYGNSSNVHYMVQTYEVAGIAGVVIEDKLFPKVNSFMPGRQDLASIPEFCGKLSAAHDARRSDEFLVIARVEALIAGWGMEEALRRAKAYTEAGADAILMHSKSKKPDEIRAFLREWNKRTPIVLVPTTYPAMTYEEMTEAGVNMIIYANQCMRASITAMHAVLETMQKEKSTVSIEDNIASVKEIFELQGMMRMKEHEKKYLRTSKNVHAIITAAGEPNRDGDMQDVLQDKPVAMVDVEGKPLLRRIMDNIAIAGMQDITVIAGYKSDDVIIDTGEKRVVADYADTGIVHSIAQADDAFHENVLIHYGDVIVSPENIRSFLDIDDPVAIMISPVQREGRYQKKTFDLVSLKERSNDFPRTLDRHPRNALRAIGPSVTAEDADGEFVGLVSLNEKGIQIWRDALHALSTEEQRTISLAAFLQKLLDDGSEITTFEARTGWAEVHSKEDYEQLCMLLRSS